MTYKKLECLDIEINSCQRCRLAASRQHAVPGEGPSTTTVFLIGEAPGKEEDNQGRPFVGRAGSILTDLLSIAGLKRKEVYITSVIKCRPPKNRQPKKDEIITCRPYLEQQIALLKPRIITPMGNVATSTVAAFLEIDLGPISIAHGKAATMTMPWGKIHILPTYHPATITHNPEMKGPLEKDFAALKVVLEHEKKKIIPDT